LPSECIAGREACFVVSVRARERLANLKLALLITVAGAPHLVAGVWSYEEGELLTLLPGYSRVVMKVPALALRPGAYQVTLHVVEHTLGVKAVYEPAAQLVVVASSVMEAQGTHTAWLGTARLPAKARVEHGESPD
jgi:hypothetical protein